MRPVRILTVSRLEPRKNIDEAIRALAKLPPCSYRARIVGSGSQRSRLEQLVSKLAVKAEFLGEVGADRLPQVYGMSDVFLSTSWSEGFGLSVLEAMSSGCAVIASNIVTQRDLITDGDNGVLYNDPSQLEISLRLLVSSPSVISTLGKRARETAKRYSWKEMARNVVKVYERCIGA